MRLSFQVQKQLNYFALDVKCSMADEFLVIEGASGAGKTTILNCLAGIVTPDEGEITLGGRRLFHHAEGINVPAEKRNIGYLFQNYALFPHMTVKNNVLYGLKNKREYKNWQMRQELLEDAAQTMDVLGISHLADKSAAAISGGEKQRVALARAMVTRPALLLLDEPFSALDEATREGIYEEFLQFRKTLRIPAILITHNHRETELFADHYIRLKDGRIEA